MKVRPAQIWLTAVCLIFGVLLMVQFRTQRNIAKTVLTESSADQAQIVSNLYDANLALRKEVIQLEEQLAEQSADPNRAVVGELLSELQKLRTVNGVVPVTGTGVDLSIDAGVRAEDVQDLINELRNAGAQALALNGQRITYRTAVTAERGAMLLGGRRLERPYVFEAIGPSDTLERALTRKGGLVSYLQNTYPEGEIVVRKRAQIWLPAVGAEAASFQIAQPHRTTG